jgi:Zn finger protein HypA/HybF involved in hydrogenase expression
MLQFLSSQAEKAGQFLSPSTPLHESYEIPASLDPPTIVFFCEECGSSNEVDLHAPLVCEVCGQEQALPVAGESTQIN